jgi:hypothetical protein
MLFLVPLFGLVLYDRLLVISSFGMLSRRIRSRGLRGFLMAFDLSFRASASQATGQAFCLEEFHLQLVIAERECLKWLYHSWALFFIGPMNVFSILQPCIYGPTVDVEGPVITTSRGAW